MGGDEEGTNAARRARLLRTLQALSEPNRMRIVELLRQGPLTVGEIAERLDLRQPQTSKHLKVLAEHGVVTVRAEANKRIYGLRQEPFRDLEDWLEPLRRTLEERYENPDAYLRRVQRERSPRGGEDEG